MDQGVLFEAGDDRESFKDFLKGIFTNADQYSPGSLREAFEEWETEKEIEKEMEAGALRESEDDF